MNLADLDFTVSFPAIRGIQAKREYYLVMCPLRYITRLFCFDEKGEVPAEMRAQRVLNQSRVPEIARYIIENNDNYCFSAITASVDGDIEFIPVAERGGNRNIGTLIVPMEARFIVNDGQHRRAALQLALQECPELGRRNHSGRVVYRRWLEAQSTNVCGPQQTRRASHAVPRDTLRPTRPNGRDGYAI